MNFTENPPADRNPAPDGDNRLSMGALSRAYKENTAVELVGLQIWHKRILFTFIPLCVAVLIMSCLWSDIVGKKDAYSDINGSWQACLVSADYSYIALEGPVNTIVEEVKDVLTCVFTDAATPSKCGNYCSANMMKDCASKIPSTGSISLSNIALPTGNFLAGLSYVGVQSIIFSAIAHASLHKALRQPSWLASTIALMFWFLVAILTYYTISPILPVPNSINSTLFSYLYYSSDSDKFNDLNNGQNRCDEAFRYVWLYLILVLLIALTVFIGALIAIYAEVIRYKSPNKPSYTHLHATGAPVYLSIFGVLCYALFIIAKLVTAVTEMDGVSVYNVDVSQASGVWYRENWFPFTVATLDISTVVAVFGLMSVIRGYTVQSISAFRMALIAGIVYTISIYPGLVGAYSFYFYNNFQDGNTCYNYFLGGKFIT